MEEGLSIEAAPDNLRGSEVEAVVLTGDFDLKLNKQVYGTCTPKPHDVTMRRSGREEFAKFYDWLVSYNGVSLGSSVVRATPARREVLMWWLPGDIVAYLAARLSPTVWQFGLPSSLPKVRDACFQLSPVALGLVPGLHFLLYVELVLSGLGNADQFYLLALCRRYEVGLD